LYGCVQALTSVAMFPLVAECANADNRTQLFSAQHSTRTLVTFAGSLLGGVLPTAFAMALGVRLESAPAYRATLITGIVVMLLGLVPLFFIPDRPRKAPTRFANSWEVLRNFPQWAKVIANNALILVGASFFVPFFNVFFKEAVGVSDAVLGTIFAVASLMTGFTTLAGPYLSRRWGLAKSVVWLQLASIPFMLIMGSVRWLPAVVLAHWIRMAIVRAASPLSWSFMMGQVSEDEHGVVNGLIMTLSKVSSTIVPYVSGLLQVRYGFAPSFWLGAGVYVIASALMYWFFVHQPDSDRSPAPADQP
jgi:predicted MFS family arabinose efflux permease